MPLKIKLKSEKLRLLQEEK
jgi:hypothetical protein